MKIIQYSPKLAKDLTDVFYDSVHSINTLIYSIEQKHAWAPLPINYLKWANRFNIKKPFILTINNEVAGFIELESDGHIDCTYVTPKFERKGVATKLLKHAMYIAKKNGLKELYVEASIVAKPLFEKFGFMVENENKVNMNNIILLNYSMRVRL
ncbi:histone acetyltransferase [Pseudoalteromonas sp. NBT06-2]|uniref:GNAT family N-acetyltransferase n=1 Tax=Pseudoalteromonas sp. NBT06-2 TaxID=2025950 RepID=UPI000BA7433C|nr:GNAT family N-acetyltransferase [Pseudoalteromonas sp. NBT06-2]PAJ76283.1 histone acetyltransferase [Pseudoalteromonas sp. NBT06-2]